MPKCADADFDYDTFECVDSLTTSYSLRRETLDEVSKKYDDNKKFFYKALDGKEVELSSSQKCSSVGLNYMLEKDGRIQCLNYCADANQDNAIMYEIEGNMCSESCGSNLYEIVKYGEVTEYRCLQQCKHF